jgi:hypothetical protein
MSPTDSWVWAVVEAGRRAYMLHIPVVMMARKIQVENVNQNIRPHCYTSN